MKKRAFALICAVFLILGALPAASAQEGDARKAADTLFTLGLLENTDYRLTETATRLDAVSLLVRLSGAAVPPSASPFRDVAGSDAPAVAYAAAQGWVAGLSPDTFGPDRPATANAWFTMLLRMLGYRDREGDFTVGGAAVFARRIGLSSRSCEGELTRELLVQSALDALVFPFRDRTETPVEQLVRLGRCSEAAVNALGLASGELTVRQAVDRHMSAVFCMDIYQSEQSIEEDDPESRASGFFISPDGIAATNYHTIHNGIAANATLVTGETFPVERVLWYDRGMDLAVIRVSRTSTAQTTVSAFACLEIAGSEEVRAGDTVYTISNPLGRGLAVSNGIVSAIGRVTDSYALPSIMNTADVSQGSSGGALLNIYGRVVGITSGAYRGGNNMYLAVPSDMILTVDLSGPGQTLQEVADYQASLPPEGEADG